MLPSKFIAKKLKELPMFDIYDEQNLLEHTVGNLDPLYIVSLVPDGLEITRLLRIISILKHAVTDVTACSANHMRRALFCHMTHKDSIFMLGTIKMFGTILPKHFSTIIMRALFNF
ncbi:hypothetical protein ACJX0J_036378 [Zea mays]